MNLHFHKIAGITCSDVLGWAQSPQARIAQPTFSPARPGLSWKSVGLWQALGLGFKFCKPEAQSLSSGFEFYGDIRVIYTECSATSHQWDTVARFGMHQIMANAAGTNVRTKRAIVHSARVIDPSNVGEKQLPSHKTAQAREIQRLKEIEATKRSQVSTSTSHKQSIEEDCASDSEPEAVSNGQSLRQQSTPLNCCHIDAQQSA